MTNLPIVRPKNAIALPDNAQWENRFEIKSASSNRIYIVSQNIKKRHWGCSCPGWKRYRKCKHLESLGLPANEKPHEVLLEV
jgi:hypothetical protein